MKRAIVLYNLGGPDRLESVAPFLFNLFNDKAIISLPQPFRFLVASLIAKRRAPLARDIYANIGGGSPILAQTEAQATKLREVLRSDQQNEVFVAMRYWHPTVRDTLAKVKAFAPDEILMVPLYPQYSTTTTGSFSTLWEKECRAAGLNVPTKSICCYPLETDFIRVHVELLRVALAQAGGAQGHRVLFSAHGLPKRIIERGDPYQWQVERTAHAIVAALGEGELDWRITYQSRVGPLEWIGPATDEQIVEAGRAGLGLIVVPIAFVSEHSETLVELDIEYRALAQSAGVTSYLRVPTPGAHETYIAALGRLVSGLEQHAASLQSQNGGRLCPAEFGSCPNKQMRSAA